jgi:predicted amidohydrolase
MSVMKVTVCELSDNQSELASEWRALVAHVRASHSNLVVLPEMPFHPWWMSEAKVNAETWNAAVASHRDWQTRLAELRATCILGSFPANRARGRINEGFKSTSCQTRPDSGKPRGAVEGTGDFPW